MEPDIPPLPGDNHATLWPPPPIGMHPFSSAQPGLPVLLDPQTRHLRVTELKRKTSTPYDGAPHRFWAWLHAIENRTKALALDPMDMMDILEAHTTAEPLQVVQNLRSAAGTDPADILSKILIKLKRRFGSGVNVAKELLRQLNDFPSFHGGSSDPGVAENVRSLSDLCQMVESHMASAPELQMLNHATGTAVIRGKLPDFLLNEWRRVGSSYRESHSGTHPPFAQFCEFLDKKEAQLCDPSFGRSKTTTQPTSGRSHGGEAKSARTFKTDTSDKRPQCPLHDTNSHTLSECTLFSAMEGWMKDSIIKAKGLCFRCLGDHHIAACSTAVSCEMCQSQKHTSAMHRNERNSRPPTRHDKQSTTTDKKAAAPEAITQPQASNPAVNVDKDLISLCTAVCGKMGGRSCSKTVLVDIRSPGQPDKILRAYAIIDEQSDTSFADGKLFKFFGITSPIHHYSISTLVQQKSRTNGMVATGLTITGAGEHTTYSLPKLSQNDMIPNTKDEVATPMMVKAQPHLSHLSKDFLELDDTADVLLLIGRDGGNILGTKSIGEQAPFAHHTALGWAVVGSVCPHDTRSAPFRTLATEVDHDHFRATPIFTPQQWQTRHFQAISR